MDSIINFYKHAVTGEYGAEKARQRLTSTSYLRCDEDKDLK